MVATEIDVTHLRRLELPNLNVIKHNIPASPLEPLQAGSFDLVGVRCASCSPTSPAGQEAAIKRIAQCLRPSGWLIDEDATGAPRARLIPVRATVPRAGARSALRRRDLLGRMVRSVLTSRACRAVPTGS